MGVLAKVGSLPWCLVRRNDRYLRVHRRIGAMNEANMTMRLIKPIIASVEKSCISEREVVGSSLERRERGLSLNTEGGRLISTARS